MPVMRSVFYVPSNNEKMVGKAPTIACDVLTLDLEDSVPPAEKFEGPRNDPAVSEECPGKSGRP